MCKPAASTGMDAGASTPPARRSDFAGYGSPRERLHPRDRDGRHAVRRAACLVALALALCAPAATAAPFGALPFVPAGGPAVCLQPTGVSGELVRWVPGGVEFLEALPTGLVATGRMALGPLQQC